MAAAGPPQGDFLPCCRLQFCPDRGGPLHPVIDLPGTHHAGLHRGHPGDRHGTQDDDDLTALHNMGLVIVIVVIRTA